MVVSVSPFLTHWSRSGALQPSLTLPMAVSVWQWSASAVVTFRPSAPPGVDGTRNRINQRILRKKSLWSVELAQAMVPQARG